MLFITIARARDLQSSTRFEADDSKSCSSTPFLYLPPDLLSRPTGAAAVRSSLKFPITNPLAVKSPSTNQKVLRSAANSKPNSVPYRESHSQGSDQEGTESEAWEDGDDLFTDSEEEGRDSDAGDYEDEDASGLEALGIDSQSRDSLSNLLQAIPPENLMNLSYCPICKIKRAPEKENEPFLDFTAEHLVQCGRFYFEMDVLVFIRRAIRFEKQSVNNSDRNDFFKGKLVEVLEDFETTIVRGINHKVGTLISQDSKSAAYLLLFQDPTPLPTDRLQCWLNSTIQPLVWIVRAMDLKMSELR